MPGEDAPTTADPGAFEDGVDWRLGAEDTKELVIRWCVVGFLGVIAAFFAVVAALFAGRNLGRGRFGSEVTCACSFALFAVTGWWAVFVHYARRGWWGSSVEELCHEMTSAAGTLRASLPVFSGLRATHSRHCVVFAAPYRMVLVSRGWNPWVIGGFLLWITVVVVSCIGESAQGVIMTLITGLGSVAACVFLVGRRAEAHEIPWDDLAALLPDGGGGFRVRLPGGPLAPEFQFTPWLDQHLRFLSGVLQYRPDLVPEEELESDIPPDAPPPPQAVPPDEAIEERLSRVQKRYQDED